MISKSILLLMLSLLCLPIAVSGDEVLTLQEIKEIKGFSDVSEVSLLESDSSTALFYRFENEGEVHWAVREETNTKSGTITYLALFNSELKIVQLSVPQFQNSQNASLSNSLFLRQFRKKTPVEKPIRLGRDIDAISGATSSTGSLISAVNRSSLVLANLAESP